MMKTWLILFATLLATVTSKPIMMEERAASGTTWNYWTNKAYGVNLGNWLILERWMGGQAFDAAQSNGQDEWTLASTSNASAILKAHWDTWVTEDDFRKLARAKVNHVRIPVGYWAFITPDAGEPYVHQGQKAQIERILGYCATYDMYALIDLHGLPGSQNGETHSGHNSGRTDFFTKYNIDRSLRTVQSVVEWTNQLDDDRLKSRLAGIEVANEPKPKGDAQEAMLKDYYRRAYTIIAASSYKLPMVFHDAFRGPAYWRGFFPSTANAVLDVHPYWAFPPSNDKTAILRQVCDKKTDHGSIDLPVLYGEWSLASGVPRSDDWMRQFLDTQVSVYQNAAGAVFWSLKNTIGSDAWSFEQLLDENIVTADTFARHPMARC